MTKVPSVLRLPEPEKIEAALHLPPGFLLELADESDWAFVVKSHALLEAALAALLARRGEPRLAAFFQHLPFGGNRNSKIVVARSLGLIDEPAAKFLVEFAKLRNMLVHDVTLVRFTLDSYVSAMDRASFRQLADSFGSVIDELRGPEVAEARRQLAQLHLRFLLYFAVMVSIAQMHFAVYPNDLAEVETRWKQSDEGKWAIAVILFVLIAFSAQKKAGSNPPSA